MRSFHFSFDIAQNSDITTSEVVQFLCGELLCKIVFHRVKSTFIFETDEVLSTLAAKIEQKFPEGIYYELSEVKDGCRGKQNPEIKEDYCIICDTFRSFAKNK